MMALLEEILGWCQRVEQAITDLPSTLKLSTRQVVVSELSEFCKNLGLISVGELRSGNNVDPGNGFTGIRIGYPGFFYNNDYWAIAGIEDDGLEVGLSLTDGKIYAGDGAVILDSDGIKAYNEATLTFQVEPDGDVKIGSDISAPATTAMCVFATAQTYNSEAMGEGDLLYGDNSTNKANILWDKSAGQMKFRSGVTAQAYIDTDGTLVVLDLDSEGGTIGGWDIGTTTLSAGTTNVILDSSNKKISINDATFGNAGIQLDYNSGTPRFYVGNGSTKYFSFDGTNAYVNGAQITGLAAGSETSIQGWQSSIVFSSSDADTVAWAAGSIILMDGTTYSIDAGNTGNMTSKTYIYLDIGTSTTVLQTTTTAATAVGSGKILIAIAEDGTSEATFQVFGGSGGIKITAGDIEANSITANEIAANTITAGEMNVSELSAITADAGILTAGEIRVGTGVVGTNFTGTRIGENMNYGGTNYNIVGLNNETLQIGLSNANGKLYFGVGSGYLGSDGLVLDTGDDSWNGITFKDITNGHITGYIYSAPELIEPYSEILGIDCVADETAFEPGAVAYLSAHSESGMASAIVDSINGLYLYSTNDKIILEAATTISLNSASGISLNDDVNVTGDLDVTGDVISNNVSLTDLSLGWILVEDTWTYAWNTSTISAITVPSDATTIYSVGDRIRLKQGGAYKYFTVIGVASTLLSLTGGSDFTVANAAITDVYYSKGISPTGFPNYFNWTPVFTGFSSDPTNVTATFSVIGRTVFFEHNAATNGTSNAANFNISLPITAATLTNGSWTGACGYVVDNSSVLTGACRWYVASAGTVINLFANMGTGTWTTSGGKRARLSGWYRI